MPTPREPTPTSMTGSNPFSTRFIRPDAMPYLFPPGYSAESLLGRLKENGWWGEIIAPHGSGKSTLLHAIEQQLVACGRKIDVYSLNSDKPVIDWAHQSVKPWDATTQVIIDGYEQLSWWNAMRLQRMVKQAGAGLLVTGHKRGRLPPLIDLTPTLATAQAIVDRLLQGDHHLITENDVRDAFEGNHGNLREMLFRLYDVYEMRIRFPPPRTDRSTEK